LTNIRISFHTKEVYPVKRFLQVLFFITVFLISTGKTMDAQNGLHIESIPRVVKQGEVCIIKASGPDSLKSIDGEFRRERFPMALNEKNGIYEGLIGIDVGTRPATYEVKVTARDGDGQVYSGRLLLKVEEVVFGTEELSLPSHVVDLNAKDLERVKKEEKQLQALFQGFREERLWTGAFIRPVEGEISGAFGLNRIMNGKQRSRHTGVDLKAEEGVPVWATNSGMVVLVDELFFTGKSVILDHGWGLYSMYFHLSEVSVKKGDRVDAGAMLGRVGSTGRSTGSHLHWGVKLNGARVDPFSLLRLRM
jgi:murein DD-endopeptidase MepM/ murein hydrolase activator NlpD